MVLQDNAPHQCLPKRRLLIAKEPVIISPGNEQQVCKCIQNCKLYWHQEEYTGLHVKNRTSVPLVATRATAGLSDAAAVSANGLPESQTTGQDLNILQTRTPSAYESRSCQLLRRVICACA